MAYLFYSTLTAISPAIFVLLLGYSAGRAKRFNADQVKGINELVLNFALPAALFVGIVGTSSSRIEHDLYFFLAIWVVLFVFYGRSLAIGRFLLRLNSSSAALFALAAAFPAPFFGPSILGGLFGKASSAIAITAVAYAHLVVRTVVILESARIRASISGTSSSEGRKVIIQSLIKAGKAPYVWAPAVALVIVLLGIPVPSLINSMLSLIGQGSAGVALFVGGLMLAAHKVKVDKVVSINTLLKSFVEPLLMLAFVLMFGLTKKEGLLLHNHLDH
jgi:malonate transporter and related proteins